jgi:hypothetical protein
MRFVVRRPLSFLVVAMTFSACGPCHVLEQAPIRREAYWPSRGVQKSSLCDPERGPYRCLMYGPRCERDDPRCGPMPMGDYHACYDPKAVRMPAYEPDPGPSCRFDGECIVSSGCDGSYCTHYTRYPMGAEACNQDSGVDWKAYDPLLCGCVRNRCTPYTM